MCDFYLDLVFFFFFKQKTAYEMRISDWSSDVCSSDLLAGTPVTLNAVCPGFTDTDLVAASVETITAKTGRDEASARASLAAFNPQGRLIDPQEVADTVLWLCLPSSRSITGQAIAVSGGEVT